MSQGTRRSTVVPIVVGLLAILAIGMGAATLDTAQSPEGGSGVWEPPDGGETGAGDPTDGDPNQVEDGERPDTGLDIQISYCIDFLASGIGTGLVVLGFLGIVGGIFYRYNFSAALLGGWTMLPPVLLVYFLLTNCETGGGGGNQGSGGGPVPGAEAPVSVSQVPPWVMGVIVGGVLLGAIGLLYWSANKEDSVTPQAEEDAMEGDPDLDRFAEAAGRAADRIEEHNAEVDNAVYRAWLEMTDLLDVEDRDSYSPRDFAEEAIALGMAEADVNELTRLFNEVRYGHRDASTREDQAVSVLRTIESEYGGDVEIDENSLDTDEEER